MKAFEMVKMRMQFIFMENMLQGLPGIGIEIPKRPVEVEKQVFDPQHLKQGMPEIRQARGDETIHKHACYHQEKGAFFFPIKFGGDD